MITLTAMMMMLVERHLRFTYSPSMAAGGLYAHQAKSVAAQPIVPVTAVSVEFAILRQGDYSCENLVTFGQFLQLCILKNS